MIPWKQRLYAFLLRRILGPFLDETSNRQLHDSVDVSLNDGRIVLTDVGLDADRLSSLLTASPACSGLAIVRAKIDRLEIRLRLQENASVPDSSSSAASADAAAERQQESSVEPTATGTFGMDLASVTSAMASTIASAATDASTQSSIAWRAMKLGTVSHDDSPTVSLVAEVTVTGVTLEVRSDPEQHGRPSAKNRHEENVLRHDSVRSTDPSDAASNLPDSVPPKSMIASYIDAALASLQLTLHVHNVRIRLVDNRQSDRSSRTNEPSSSWVELRVAAIRYQDLKERRKQHDTTGNPKQAHYQKTLAFTDVSILTGGKLDENDRSSQTDSNNGTDSPEYVMMHMGGTGQVFVRVFRDNPVSPSQPSETTVDDTASSHIQQDIEVILNQRLHVSVDERSLQCAQTVVTAFAPHSRSSRSGETKSQPPISTQTTAMFRQLHSDSEDDEKDLHALSVIMKQYREAYHLAEHNQLRGGILIPTNAYDSDATDNDDTNDGTFDVFFDANEGSVYNYASVLKESMMEASTTLQPSAAAVTQSKAASKDCVLTKIRLHLQGGTVKVHFTDGRCNQSFLRSPEHILAEFAGLQVQSTIGSQSISSQISIVHLQIEDALIDNSATSKAVGTSSVAGFHFSEGRLKAGNILRFDRSGQAQDGSVISEAPCIALSFNKDTSVLADDSWRSHTHCDLQLAPIEVSYRNRTVANLTKLSQSIAPASNDEASKNDYGIPESSDPSSGDSANSSTISFSCSCDSITFKAPVGPNLHDKDSYQTLFDRTYESTPTDIHAEPSIGLMLDGIQLAYGPEKQDTASTSKAQTCLSYSCHHVIAFAEAPDWCHAKSLIANSSMKRVDFFVARGRLEVNPYIPIEIKVRINCTTSQARDSLPVVPAISSFKTRQADEDEADVDRLLLSPISSIDGYSRNDLKSSSPQPQMAATAEQCTTIVLVNIPEAVSEVSVDELLCLRTMIASILPETNDNTVRQRQTVQSRNGAGTCDHDKSDDGVAVTVLIDRLSMSLCSQSRSDPSPTTDTHTLAIDRFCVHSVVNGSDFCHLRVMCHDVAVYEVHDAVQSKQYRDLAVHERVHVTRQRCLSGSRAQRSDAILYRSQLFTAISHESPSLLLDVVNAPSNSRMERMNVHFNAYHMTQRFDVDSEWCSRLLRKLDKLKPTVDSVPSDSSPSLNKERSLTRVFVSIVDCNLDYSAPKYSGTRSRSIIRVSDFRFSGNIVKPTGRLQTFSISMGDLGVHICNEQQSYAVENSRLCRSVDMLHPSDCCIGFVSMSPPDTLLREMNFVHIVSLDSMDAIVAIASDNGDVTPAAVNGPRFKSHSNCADVTLSVTLGLLTVHACRDSFKCFASTIGDLQAKMTALSKEEIKRFTKQSSEASHIEIEEKSDTCAGTTRAAAATKTIPVDNLLDIPTAQDNVSFLLDGYDWTTIDHDPLPAIDIPEGEEQAAVWYSPSELFGSSSSKNYNRVPHYLLGAQKIGSSSRINTQHFPMHPLSDPLSEGDMDAARYAETRSAPKVTTRVLVHKLDFKLRLFDGYDWPDAVSDDIRAQSKKDKFFIIESELQKEEQASKEIKKGGADKIGTDDSNGIEELKTERRSALLDDLLYNGDDTDTVSNHPGDGTQSTFAYAPLPEERMKKIMKESERRYFARKTHRFFQVTANKVQVRIDSYAKVDEHQLASVLELAVDDLFIMETVSSVQPVKMFGEWVNEKEHPRDSRTGAVMVKLITWEPKYRLAANSELVGDQCEFSIEFLPMRCLIDQSAINFARAFFASNEDADLQAKRDAWISELHLIPSPRFESFRIRPWKLKVDYYPKKLNIDALRDGSIVELVNLSPIDAMVITLNEISVQDAVGFGEGFSGAVSQWIQDICATQLYKFLTSARPFEPFSNVAGGISDLVVLPYEAYANGESIGRAMKAGFSQLAGTIAFEALTTTSRLTKFAATQLARMLEDSNPHLCSASSNPLPSRPLVTPRGMSDVTSHALESLARGLKAANYKVVVVPYRELSRNGTTGAVKSVVRGIPVLIVAPLTGATEAISYTLLGARNALRPDIRKEEEAAMAGLSCTVQY